MSSRKYVSVVILAAAGLLTGGCTIVSNARAVPANTRIEKIYVAENKALHMAGLVPEVVLQLQQLGFRAETYSGALPAGAKHHLKVTANWQWDMAMYLTYFQATLFDGEVVLGVAEYDARRGGANLGKFGPTGEKIKPLLRQLLAPAAPR